MKRLSGANIVIACSALAFALGCPPTRAPEPEAGAPAPAGSVPSPAPPAPCLRIVSLEVAKSERRLFARCEAGAIVSMTVALGRDPEGPKQAAGDHRTPEGPYRIAGPARPSRFHRFIPIDYPTAGQAATALSEGRISPQDYWRIRAAHDRGEPPPADTPLGGMLGFHGEGDRWRGDSLHLDWTFGCVGMTDADIDFLAERVAPGTPVEIRP